MIGFPFNDKYTNHRKRNNVEPVPKTSFYSQVKSSLFIYRPSPNQKCIDDLRTYLTILNQLFAIILIRN